MSGLIQIVKEWISTRVWPDTYNISSLQYQQCSIRGFLSPDYKVYLLSIYHYMGRDQAQKTKVDLTAPVISELVKKTRRVRWVLNKQRNYRPASRITRTRVQCGGRVNFLFLLSTNSWFQHPQPPCYEKRTLNNHKFLWCPYFIFGFCFDIAGSIPAWLARIQTYLATKQFKFTCTNYFRTSSANRRLKKLCLRDAGTIVQESLSSSNLWLLVLLSYVYSY